MRNLTERKPCGNSTFKPGAWEPAYKKDGTYCSPACGAGCTMEAFKQAHDGGSALAERLGLGWTYRVRENMKWFYTVYSPCRRIKVCVNRGRDGDTTYTAFLGEPDSPGGYWTHRDEDPRGAVRGVVATGREALAKMGAIFEGLDYFEEAS